MKVKKFGTIKMVNGEFNELIIKDFVFDAEGAHPPCSNADLVKSIIDYLANLSIEDEILTIGGNLEIVE